VDSFGRFSSVLTQSRVVRFLANRSMELGAIGDMTLSGLGLDSPAAKLIFVKSDDKVLDAFLAIYNQRVSGTAVLDNTGRIIGNISISDLKDIGFAAGMFRKLYQNVGSFLERKVEGQDVPKLVWTYSSSPLRDVLYRLRANGIHRCYLVENDSMKPAGVITLTDILRVFATLQPNLGSNLSQLR